MRMQTQMVTTFMREQLEAIARAREDEAARRERVDERAAAE